MKLSDSIRPTAFEWSTADDNIPELREREAWADAAAALEAKLEAMGKELRAAHQWAMDEGWAALPWGDGEYEWREVSAAQPEKED